MGPPVNTIRSPAREPVPPRRPPRPVSVMPIVVEYPPSIRNVSLDNNACARPTSGWSSDDDDVMRRRCAAFFKFERDPVSTGRRSDRGGETHTGKKLRWLLLGIIVFTLILIGAIVGGVLGSRLKSTSSGDGKEKAATSWSLGVSTLAEHTKTTETASRGEPSAIVAKPTIWKGSKVGSTIAMPVEDPYRVVAFLNADGHLATSIWTGNRLETFAITSDADSELPKPTKSSPLHLIVLYQSPSVHILYVDEDGYLCLATMSGQGERGKPSWKGGRLETGDDGTEDSKPEKHKTTEDLRVAFEVHTNAADEMVDGQPADRVNILYEEGSKEHRGKDMYTLLSTVAPEDPTRWHVSTYKLGEGDEDSMNPQKGSQSLVLMPLFKDAEVDPGRQSGVRILWDRSDKDHDSSFGVMKCKVKTATKLDECWFDTDHWKTETEHDKFLAMPKPLSLTYQRLPSKDDKSAPQDFVLLVLDGDEVFTELYWDGYQWDGVRRFLAVEDKSYNATRPFSSIAVTSDGHLFGVSDGKLRWYERIENWWEGGFGEHNAGWKLVEVVNTTLVNAKEGS